jgi:hypothetical protein
VSGRAKTPSDRTGDRHDFRTYDGKTKKVQRPGCECHALASETASLTYLHSQGRLSTKVKWHRRLRPLHLEFAGWLSRGRGTSGIVR